MTGSAQDFPIRFDDPADAEREWTFQPRNFPDQTTPLEFDVAVMMFQGMLDAREHFGLSSEAMLRRLNTYVYVWAPGIRPAQGEISDAMREEVLGLRDNWDDHYLPEILASLGELGGVDVQVLSPGELGTHLDEAWQRVARLFVVHFLVLTPAREAIQMFVGTYRELFDASELDAHTLLGGVATKTTECSQALWRLSRTARRTPAVRKLLETVPATEINEAVHRAAGAEQFNAELEEFLATFGQRTDTVSIMQQSWREDPAPVFATIKGYLGQPDSADPALALARAAGERERAVAGARELLEQYPGVVVEEFEKQLAAAQAGTALSEDNTHYINFGGVYELRRILLEAGRLLARGDALAEPDDVLFLTLAEVRRALADGGTGRFQDEVARRRAEMTRWAGVRPPATVGAPGPAGAGGQPGSGAPAGAGGAAEPDLITGVAGAQGVVCAVARVLGSVAQAERLRPGEVLVTEQTQPSWTPLFTVASAVVTDTGGVLNHAAIAAREYGIPAVVGAAGATTAIHDGDLVEVDGGAGTVRIKERA